MTDEQAVQKITVGSVVAGRYEIRGLIGKGGMGEVFLAHDLQADRDVALKTLHPKYSQSRHAIARFGREVRLARQLNHPGIVKIFDAQKWENTLFYTMEYIEGKSLRAWLQQRRALDLGSTVRVLCLVAEALEHAHRITIHRDLGKLVILTAKATLDITSSIVKAARSFFTEEIDEGQRERSKMASSISLTKSNSKS